MPRNILAPPPKWTKQFNSIDEAPAFLNVSEASILFRLSEDIVRTLCKNKTFVAAKLGSEWRIDKEATNKKLFNYN